MKQQTDLTAKDLSAAARRHFRTLVERLGSQNVTGGEWYVRLRTSPTGVPLLLLVIPVTIRRDNEWHAEEWQIVVA